MLFDYRKLVISNALLCAALLSDSLPAHNKVAVIPMGDEELAPFALIPTAEPNTTDYTSINGVTLDKITGLEWQQDDNNTDFLFNNANRYCSDLVLGGKNDWRLPDIKELLSIATLNASDPAINETAFSNTASTQYWSATDVRSIIDQRWGVNFLDGSLSSTPEGDALRVRCVRSNGQTALANVFKDNGNGSISDLASGLTWQQQDDGVRRSQIDAFRYCRDLILAGRSDWRLPPLKELASIVDYDTNSPAVDSRLFPATKSWGYWSGSFAGDNANSRWLIFFTNGNAFNITGGFTAYVRCASIQGSTTREAA